MSDIVERAKELRLVIESNAEDTMDDTQSLEYPELFPKWKVNAEYTTGERVRYKKELYKCVQSHTSQVDWAPDFTPSLWVRVADPQEEWPAWVQPTGAHDSYMMGEKVSHNGKHWTSDINNNVYEPGVYGWTEV